MKRERGKAFEGKGYGTLRYHLYTEAKQRIERSIEDGYYCEAVTLIESMISDRLESRISYLKQQDFGFKMLGDLISHAQKIEHDEEMKHLIEEVNVWRGSRNRALHELVKIEAGKEHMRWDERLMTIKHTATVGYDLLKRLYHRVADLNPLHTDRVF